jgi:hypothetical protein
VEHILKNKKSTMAWSYSGNKKTFAPFSIGLASYLQTVFKHDSKGAVPLFGVREDKGENFHPFSCEFLDGETGQSTTASPFNPFILLVDNCAKS